MKVCEVFHSLCGEGKYVGQPAWFVRTSGCSRACLYCDSKYHTEGKEMTPIELSNMLPVYGKNIVVFTGGEPLIFKEEIEKAIDIMCEDDYNCFCHLESNGDFLEKRDLFTYDYLAISPKEVIVASNIADFFKKNRVNGKHFDIKVVTDLDQTGVDMIKYATMLMPLTTQDPSRNIEIQKEVWNYCVDHNIKYSPRIHVDVWGINKRGV